MPDHPFSPPTPRQMRIFRQAMIEGVPRDQIAAEHRLTRGTIDRNIRRVERWLAIQVIALESALVGNLHLERLEHQWNELMSAWARSKQDQVVTKASTDKQGQKRAEQTRKTTAGDVRFLEQARRVLADIRKLLGIQHIPTEEELLDNVDTLTLEQRFDLLYRLLEKVGHAQADSADVPLDRGPNDAQPAEESGDDPDAA